MTVVRVYLDDPTPPDFTKLTPLALTGVGVVEAEIDPNDGLNPVAGFRTFGQEIVSGTSFLDYVYRDYFDYDLDVLKAFLDPYRVLGVSATAEIVTSVPDWDALYTLYGITYP